MLRNVRGRVGSRSNGRLSLSLAPHASASPSCKRPVLRQHPLAMKLGCRKPVTEPQGGQVFSTGNGSMFTSLLAAVGGLLLLAVLPQLAAGQQVSPLSGQGWCVLGSAPGG